MKLTIDTSADSKDDLRKVIRFLQLMVNERDFRNLPERKRLDESKTEPQETSKAVTQFFNIFDTPQKVESPPPKKETYKIDFF